MLLNLTKFSISPSVQSLKVAVASVVLCGFSVILPGQTYLVKVTEQGRWIVDTMVKIAD